MRTQTKHALDEIAAERERQVDAEGWTPEHDDGHDRGELARAAACYAHGDYDDGFVIGAIWPWSEDWWKPSDRRRELIKAGALIVAELERLERSTPANEETGRG